MKIITGHTGTHHVQSLDDAVFNTGIVSGGDRVLKTGKMLSPQLLSGNVVRISAGDIVYRGRHARIESYEDIKIPNGSQGANRTDAIVARYEMDDSTGIESITLQVIRGGNGAAAVPLPGDMLLYHVALTGVNITSVAPAFRFLPSITDLEQLIASTEQALLRKDGDNCNVFNNKIAASETALYKEIRGLSAALSGAISDVSRKVESNFQDLRAHAEQLDSLRDQLYAVRQELLNLIIKYHPK